MKKKPAEFPLLCDFLRGYLHQDVVPEYGTPEKAARAYLADLSQEERSALGSEAQDLASAMANMNVADINKRLTEMGSAWSFESPENALRMLAVFRRKQK